MSDVEQAGPAQPGPVRAHRLRGAPKVLVLTGWLLAPIVVVGVLCAAIWVSFKHPPPKQPPVGAGAGDAGGANAIGQMLEEGASEERAEEP